MENNIDSEQEMDKNGDFNAETATKESSGAQKQADKEMDIDPLKRAQDDLSEAKDKYVRLYAEFENHRRRTAKEKLEMIQGANENLLKAILPILDDFERAEKSFKDKNDKEAEGFFLIQNKFKKTLEQFGVKLMEIAKGSDFNPDFQEAITSVPTDDKLKGKVVDVVEKGYLLNDKVIRFAKVVTGS